MSVVSIRAALETALAAITPAMSTAYENAPFTPVNGTAYQKCNILFATPDNREMGDRHQEQCFMQVMLMYPLGSPTYAAGSRDAMTRAELIRTTFKKGNTFSSGGITTLITSTPTIEAGSNSTEGGGRYAVPVKINFMAQIG